MKHPSRSHLKIVHRQPCAECPWRKSSAAGWLGGNRVEDYADPVKHGVPVPCHMIADRMCAGCATVMRNSCTVPRDPRDAVEVAKVSKSDDVFMFVPQFEKHHSEGVLATTQREDSNAPRRVQAGIRPRTRP